MADAEILAHEALPPEDRDEAIETEKVDSSATPVRDLNPITFFGPHGDPVVTRDFRATHGPVMDDDTNREDGHGRFRHPSQHDPVHPSAPRKPAPWEVERYDLKVDDDGNLIRDGIDPEPEESGTPESGGNTQGSPLPI